MPIHSNNIIAQEQCFHCGLDCKGSTIAIDEKLFCCNGCKVVYQILDANNLCTYYDLNQHPGANQQLVARKDKFEFLDNEEIANSLITFKDQKQTHVRFYLPQIHCSSCLWLLENANLVDDGIISAQVNFVQKEIFIVFDQAQTALRKVVEALVSIGYEPHLQLDATADNKASKIDRSRWYKLGVAGFCFANIMMMSLADYFSIGNAIDSKIILFFNTASLLLSIPVLFYAATEFFVSAWNALRNKYVNIDVPVALALVITFFRSLYDIYYGISNGYLDSMSGIVFFMLIGRWLQSRTYQSISFDRDYRSFFPIAINVLQDDHVIPISVENIKKGDIIQIHTNEILPMDAILSKGNAAIDYSFVNGESVINEIAIGEIIYAGAKQTNGLIELVVINQVSQSYLSNLWNNPAIRKDDNQMSSFYDVVGKYFTYVVLLLGALAGGYWFVQGNIALMWNAITTVLIVACPCALLLSSNFTNGHLLNVFGKAKFYLRSSSIIEKLDHIQHIVLDKTGTITQVNKSRVQYFGETLSTETKIIIASIFGQSAHPFSKAINEFLNIKEKESIQNIKEIPGNGIEAWHNDQHYKIGSATFVGLDNAQMDGGSLVVVKIDEVIVGKFVIANSYRFGMTNLVNNLRKEYSLSLLSGDNDTELQNIQKLLGVESEIKFNQSPEQKLNYVQDIARTNTKVMMVGDGLNDAGALLHSYVGVAVADNGNTFTPACDAIIAAEHLQFLDQFIALAKTGKRIILTTFIFSAIYNIIGLYYAIQGTLSPVIAAILMPLSSITIILLSYTLVHFAQKKHLRSLTT